MERQALTIRPAGPGDLAALQCVGEASYRDHFAGLWTPAGLATFLAADFSAAALRSSLAAPDRSLWLLACEGLDRPVGYAKINWAAADPISGLAGAELQKIYFLGACVGKGYGRALWTRVLGCVRERSARSSARIWLDVLKSNTTARRFYERNGLRVLGELPFRTDRADIGLVVMAREFEGAGACPDALAG